MTKNTLKTYVLLAALGGLLVLIGGAIWRGSGALIGLVVGLLFVGGSYWFSDKIAIRAARAQPVDEAQAPGLYRIVRELTTAANMPMPRIYMTPDDQPNAFATGRNDRKAVVAVTRGITRLLSEDELRGVVAHELAHIRNRDILIGSVAAAIAMGITFIARMAMWGAMFGGGSSDDDDGGGLLGMLFMVFLAPVAAFLLQMAVSRSREFEADRVGARIAGSGEPLARALEKLHEGAKRVPMNVHPAQAQAYIVNPLAGRRVNFAQMFSTHPPVEERITRLRSPMRV
ncbi:MAG TPA: zinc metalloprotease HtpX [Actinomycetota bacterium]|nr:zinc metalloprotease HtpX [Actinomycetota bacterium]